MIYAKSSIIILLTLMFSRSLGCLKTSFLAAICDDIPVMVCLLKYFLMDTFALSIFYFLKTIGNSDFVVGKMTLPSIPLFLLIFIPNLYAISNRPNVRIKPNAIYAADSKISMVLYRLPFKHQFNSV